MTRILDFNGRDAERTVTVATIAGLKGTGRQLVQVTAGTAEEAEAAEAAGIDMVVCLAQAVPEVRQGSSRLFVTAAIDFGGEITLDDLLATAFRSLSAGADAVITARRSTPCGSWPTRASPSWATWVSCRSARTRSAVSAASAVTLRRRPRCGDSSRSWRTPVRSRSSAN